MYLCAIQHETTVHKAESISGGLDRFDPMPLTVPKRPWGPVAEIGTLPETGELLQDNGGAKRLHLLKGHTSSYHDTSKRHTLMRTRGPWHWSGRD